MTSGKARIFTPDQIRAIRASRQAGASMMLLARYYGVCYDTITAIIYRISYRDVPDFVNHKESEK